MAKKRHLKRLKNNVRDLKRINLRGENFRREERRNTTQNSMRKCLI